MHLHTTTTTSTISSLSTILDAVKHIVRIVDEELVVLVVVVMCECIVVPKNGVTYVETKVIPDELLTFLGHLSPAEELGSQILDRKSVV